MNDIEVRLKDMLAERAGSADLRAEGHKTIRRARTRRAINGGVSALAIVAVVAAGAMGIRTVARPTEDVREVAGPGHTTEGEYGFTSRVGEGSVVAEGTFGNASWELTQEMISGDAYDSLAVNLVVHGPEGSADGHLEIPPGDVLLSSEPLELVDVVPGADAVFGLALGDIGSVEVETGVEGQIFIPAHTFRQADPSSPVKGRFFVAFVPDDSPGMVHAIDELGIFVDSKSYGGLKTLPSVLAGGRTDAGGRWSVLFDGSQEDRACLMFSSERKVDTECFPRVRIGGGEPLDAATFEREGVFGVVAIMSAEVDHVRLARDGMEPAVLPWFQPRQEDLGRWPVRVVAVGLDPGTSGALQAFDASGEVLGEHRF